jgi:hypothetical protein
MSFAAAVKVYEYGGEGGGALAGQSKFTYVPLGGKGGEGH